MGSSVHYEPYDTQDLPQDRDLADQSWTQYKVNASEAQVTEILEQLDESDVRKFLTNTVGYLNDSNVRKLLVHAAVSNDFVYMDLCGEVAHIQFLKKNEKAQEILQQRSRPAEFAPQLQQAQKPSVPKQPEPPMTDEPDFYAFDKNILQVDYIINEKWAKLSGSKQYNRAWDATDLVNKEIAKIAQSITKKSHHLTKIGAIHGLCEIGSIVAVGGDCIGAEVRKHVGHDVTLVNAMLGIVSLMTIDEKRALGHAELKILEEFDKERKAYCVFDDFPKVLETFKQALAGPQTAAYDLDDDDDYGDIDEQALLNKSDAIEGSASQPITV